jgi:aminoglycoside 6'-N-acetyltransferase I
MSAAVIVRSATAADAAAWESMRQALWPDESNSHGREVADYFRGVLPMPLEVLLAVDGNGRPIGFAELSIRNYAEGCESDRVAFLEGWYVDPAYRRQGVGAMLVQGAEAWARARGCREFGSDAELDNDVSHAAHRALGFQEIVRIVSYKKDL